MAGSAKEVNPNKDDIANTSTENSKQKKNKFHNELSNMADRLMDKFNKEEPVRTVNPKWVEWVASKFVEYGYEITPETIQIITDYLAGYNLWLCGNVGTGKTFFFEVMNKVRKLKWVPRICKLSMIDTQGWDMEIAREWAQDYADEDVIIDDVGAEPTMKSWGQEAELFPYLLEKRMQLSGKRTHLTSNLGIIDIKRRYGERVSDRFVQMFKMEEIKMKKSKRRLKPWKTSSEEGTVFL